MNLGLGHPRLDRLGNHGLQTVQGRPCHPAQAQAELRNAQANFDRTRDLLAQGFVSKAAMDTADAQLKSAQAGRDQASAGEKQSAAARHQEQMQQHLFIGGIRRVAVRLPVTDADIQLDAPAATPAAPAGSTTSFARS